MVKEEPKIESGKNLLEVLDKGSIKIFSFFWFFLAESGSWRLIISSPDFEKFDIRKCYQDFIKDYGNNEAIKDIGISNITLLPNSNDLIKLFKIAIKTDERSISGIRFTSNVINGILIEDAYIYRLS